MRLSRSLVTEKLFFGDWCTQSAAASFDILIKYIEENYVHYTAELSAQTLAKGRNALRAETDGLD